MASRSTSCASRGRRTPSRTEARPCRRAAFRQRAIRCGLVGLFSLLAWAPAFAGPESLPPDHWAYAELEHFELRGFVVLDGTRPFSRNRVRVWVDSLRAVDPARLTAVERQRIAWLGEEFVDGAETSAARYDRPLVALQESGWGVEGDLALESGGLTTSAGADPTTAWGRVTFDVLVSYGESFAYDTRYRVALAEEAGVRTEENRLSVRERNWHGLTSDYDRAYVAFERGPLRLAVGRDYVSWGADPSDALLVSDAGLSHDGLQFLLRFGRFRLASVAARLSSSSDRNYAAHRLEVHIGGLRLGVHEAAVYTSPHFEPTYLFPIAFYYGNQFNERGDDNTLLGADARWASRWGTVDGELLVDDFIYDGDPAPNKVGWRVAATRALAARDTDVELRAVYERMTRWTFTHRRAEVAYVAGTGDPLAGDPWLGSPLGPDADRWSVRLGWTPRARTSLWLEHGRTRRGEGNRDLTAWQPGTPHDLPFPSGDVQAESRTECGARVRLGRHAEFLGIAALRSLGATHGELAAELRLDF